MKIAFGQINTTVGDFPGNEAKIRTAYEKAAREKADLLVLPELATTGYPPRDLLLRDHFVAANLNLVKRLVEMTGETGLVLGYVDTSDSKPGRHVRNAVLLAQHGRVLASRNKTLLPTYDVFDEDRYFEPATENKPVEFKGGLVGLTVCEDIWNDESFWPDRRYQRNPARELVDAGAKLILNVSASPWHLGKNQLRRSMLSRMAAALKCPIAYCNLVGGNDELIFDGASLLVNERGVLLAEGPMFREELFVADLRSAPVVSQESWTDEQKLFAALVLGLRDYLHKCGFKSALLGLSGGIDSALTAAIAVAALGKENVRGVSLPSQYSSKGSLDDARILAENLGIRYDVVPIEPMFHAAKEQLKGVFSGLSEDVTEENIQARVRGVLLMAMSNKFGSLLLTTGNKSETAVGYCTLYGDMCGGISVINDLPKQMVYRIARWINREREIIPASSITKAPSAELRPNQTDQDSLPPYDVLDAILEAYVVEGRSAREIVAAGFSAAAVQRVIRLIETSEYKRRQAAPGLKVTTKAFGLGRRIPIAHRYKEPEPHGK